MLPSFSLAFYLFHFVVLQPNDTSAMHTRSEISKTKTLCLLDLTDHLSDCTLVCKGKLGSKNRCTVLSISFLSAS